MRLQLARRPEDGKWVVFDEDLQDFSLEGATSIQVAEWLANEAKKKIMAWLTSPPPQMSYKEMRIRAGRVRCVQCRRVLYLEEYKPEWSEDKQRCKKCVEP